VANGDDTYRPVLKTREGGLADTPTPGTTPTAPPVDWQKRAKRQRQRQAFGEGLQTAGRNINQSATRSLFDQAAIAASRTIDAPEAPRFMNVPSFKKGGRMKRRGVAKLHKGERIERGKRGRKRSR
jgi:hypothetical protein